MASGALESAEAIVLEGGTIAGTRAALFLCFFHEVGMAFYEISMPSVVGWGRQSSSTLVYNHKEV